MNQATRQDEQAEKGAAPTRGARRWALLTASAVVVAAAAGAIVYGVQPAKKKPAPSASACWASLTPGGLATVVDGPGVKVSTTEIFGGWTTAGSAWPRCRIEWTDSTRTQFTAVVGADQGQYDSDLKAASTPAGQAAEGKTQQLDFGAGIKAFVNGVGAVLDVPCTASASLYVSVGTSTSSSAQPRQVQQLFADSAYKIAKAAVRQVPCSNTVAFAAAAPAVK